MSQFKNMHCSYGRWHECHMSIGIYSNLFLIESSIWMCCTVGNEFEFACRNTTTAVSLFARDQSAYVPWFQFNGQVKTIDSYNFQALLKRLKNWITEKQPHLKKTKLTRPQHSETEQIRLRGAPPCTAFSRHPLVWCQSYRHNCRLLREKKILLGKRYPKFGRWRHPLYHPLKQICWVLKSWKK